MKTNVPPIFMPIRFTLLVCLLFSLGVSAQQSVTLYQDSLLVFSGQCPTPVSATLYPNGEADNYNSVTDSIELKVFWGDGTSDTQMVQLWEAGVTDFFNGSFSHVYSLAGTYFPTVVATTPNNLADTVNPIDSVYITNNCVTIDGYVYEDLNSNCIREVSDTPKPWRMVRVTTSAGGLLGYDWADSNGYYSLTLPTGLNNLQMSTDSYYDGLTTTCPSGGIQTINSSTSQTFDFGLECVSNTYDKWVWSWAGIAPPGDTGIIATHSGVSTCNSFPSPDTLTLVLDPLTHYIGTVPGWPAPDVVSGNVLQWYFTYTPYTWNSYYAHGAQTRVYVVTDTTLSLNDTICYDAYVSAPSPEITPANNAVNPCPQVGVSYDPNNKLANPQGVGPLGNIDTSETTITYTINFQNTGTAPAKNVYILDSISDNLDLTTLRVLTASHSMELLQAKDRTVRFDFKNIYLPDSTSDEEGSKGYVIVQIDLVENLPIGTQIENTAHIFFDYNEPIVTNTALHTIYVAPDLPDPLVIDLVSTDVTCKNTDNGTLQLMILSGEPPYSIAWSNNALTEYQSGLASGTYTVVVTDDAMQIETKSKTVGENRIYDEPVIGDITGAEMVQSWQPYTYSIDEVNGSSFEWSAAGGEVLSTNNNQAEIRWNAGPEGTIYITQTDENECIGHDSSKVQISFVGIEETPESSFTMFPNPTEGTVSIQLAELAGQVTIQVVDAQGRIVIQDQFNGLQTELNLAGFGHGIYTVRLSSESSTSTQRLILR